MALAVDFLQPNVMVVLTLCSPAGEPGVCVKVRLLHHISLDGSIGLSPRSTLPMVFMHITHLMLPIVAYLSAVTVWPATDARERLMRVAMSLIAAPALLVLAGALQAAGGIDLKLEEAARSAGLERPTTLMVRADEFLQVGGEWLVVVMATAVTVGAARRAPAAPRC